MEVSPSAQIKPANQLYPLVIGN